MEITEMDEDVAVSYRYDPYGAVTITRNSQEQSSDPLGNPWTYTARFSDEETGLYYYRARYYSPGTGRFLSRGPREGEEQADSPPSYLTKMLGHELVGGSGNLWSPSPDSDDEDDPIELPTDPTTPRGDDGEGGGGEEPPLEPDDDDNDNPGTGSTTGGGEKGCSGKCPKKKFRRIYKIATEGVKYKDKRKNFKRLTEYCKTRLPDRVRNEANKECKSRGGERCYCDFKVSASVAGKTTKRSHWKPQFGFYPPGTEPPAGGVTYTLIVYCRLKITPGMCRE
jgi:RHS repeat-associated protein